MCFYEKQNEKTRIESNKEQKGRVELYAWQAVLETDIILDTQMLEQYNKMTQQKIKNISDTRVEEEEIHENDISAQYAQKKEKARISQ